MQVICLSRSSLSCCTDLQVQNSSIITARQHKNAHAARKIRASTRMIWPRSLLVSYKVVTLNRPLHLTHLLAPYTPGHSFQSQDKHLLLEPAVSTVTGSRVFSYAAPSILNKLPLESRTSSSFASFKRNRKMYYFCRMPSLRTTSPSFPSDCLCLRFGPAADNAHVTHDFIVLYCKANLVAQLQHAI